MKSGALGVIVVPLWMALVLGMTEEPRAGFGHEAAVRELESRFGGALPSTLVRAVQDHATLEVLAHSEGLLPSVSRMVEATERWREETGDEGSIVLREDSSGDRAILVRERPSIVVVHSRNPVYADEPLEYELEEYLAVKVIGGLWQREWEPFDRRTAELTGDLRGRYTFSTPEGASEEPAAEDNLPSLVFGSGEPLSEQLHDSFSEGEAAEAPVEFYQYLLARERSHEALMGASRIFEQTLRLTDRLHPVNLPEARARAALFIEWFFDRETSVEPPFTEAELDGLDLGD